MIPSSSLLAVIAYALTFTSATTLTPRQTKNNAIYTPGLNELVPVGTPYKITWKPDVPGLVNIYLLRGPAENLRVLSTIAEGIQNTGSFLWTPDTTLEDDKTHYGLNLTMPAVPGEFQYSTQFGISNPNKKGSGSGSGSGGEASMKSNVTGTTTTTTTGDPVGTNTTIVTTGSAVGNTSSIATAGIVVSNSTVTNSTGSVAPKVTSAPVTNSTVMGKTNATAIVAPTSSLKANGTTSAGGARPSSGADGKLSGGLGAVVLAFGAALLL